MAGDVEESVCVGVVVHERAVVAHAQVVEVVGAA